MTFLLHSNIALENADFFLFLSLSIDRRLAFCNTQGAPLVGEVNNLDPSGCKIQSLILRLLKILENKCLDWMF